MHDGPRRERLPHARTRSHRFGRIAGAVLLGALAAACSIPGPARAASNPSGADTPPYEVRRFTVDDGLPVNGITDLVFDRDGYLWVSTFDGVAWFDGLHFRTLNPGNTPGLSSARVLALERDAEGGVWTLPQLAPPSRLTFDSARTFGPERGFGAEYALTFGSTSGKDFLLGTWNGVQRFDGERLVSLLPDSLRFEARVLHRDDSGAVWAGSRQAGALRIGEGGIRRFTTVEGLPSDEVRAFADGPGGAVLIGTTRGLVAVRGDRVVPVEFRPAIPEQEVDRLLVSPGRDTIWVSGPEGLFRVVEGRLARELPPPPPGGPCRLVRDARGRVWYSAARTLYRDGEPVFETPSGIRSVLVGPEGGVWVATERDGLYQLVPPRYRMLLAGRSCYPILEDRDRSVWVGTIRGGLYRIRDDAPEPVPFPSPAIQALHQDPDGAMWVGTDAGLFRRRRGGWERVRWDGMADGDHVPVYALHRDRSGALWVGSGSGLHRLTGGKWEHFLTQQGEVSEYVRSFLESPDGSLWMALKGGGVLRRRNGGFRRWTTAEGLSSDNVRSLHLDDDGVLWIGTEDRGLVRLDPGGDPEIVSITPRNGLYDYVVNCILEDSGGRLWMSGNRGVYRIFRAELNAFARGEVASVHSILWTGRIETNGGVQPAGIRASDGRFWFPTVKGVLVLDPRSHPEASEPPAVRIEAATRRNAVLPVDSGRLRLPAGPREFDVAYTAPAFRAPQNLRFRYRLIGLDGAWLDAGTRRVAYFTHVPPGSYRFEVEAVGETPSAAGLPTVLEITVPKRFHETVWFRGGIAFLAVALGFVGYRRRVVNVEKRERELARLVQERTRDLHHEKEVSEGARRDAEAALATVERQARRLEELDRAKSRFYANVSHEFRTPLTLALGPLEDVLAGLRGEVPEEARRDIETASRSSRRLLRLVNQILDLAKAEAGHLQARRHTADLVGLLRDVAQDFVPFAERQKLRFELEVPEEPVWVRFDAGLLTEVFLNLLGNAFKYTPSGGTVHLQVTPDPLLGRVWVRVRDTGPGIPAAELPHIFERFHQVDEAGIRMRPGTGIGLALTRELVNLHDGSIGVESRPGEGSTFIVELPLEAAPVSVPEGEPRSPGVRERFPLDEGVGSALPVPSSRPATKEEDTPTVLVVEDNAELQAYLTRHLGAEYRVLAAGDGTEGLELIRRELPDLVVSDVLMPGLTGYQLVREVRRDPDVRFVPIVLLTARAALDDTLKGFEAGAEDYVLKPFRVEELRARIAAVLASRRRLRESLLAGVEAGDAATAPLDAEAGSEPRAAASPKAGSRPPVSADRRFLDRVRAAIDAGFPDESFSVPELAAAVGMSRSHLFRRLKDLGVSSPSDMIREARLARAAELLRARAGNVGEIAYGVGFRSLAHFSRAFRERFGVPPSRYGEPES
jgi:signal transduction histidine kinase/ligand-binding sensor domain-containing protein/CheY-like chemotaxis protein/AraC-like DNA-binding protein